MNPRTALRWLRLLRRAKAEMDEGTIGLAGFLGVVDVMTAWVDVIECAECDRTFVPLDGRNQRFCSARCRYRYGQRQYRRRNGAKPRAAEAAT